MSGVANISFACVASFQAPLALTKEGGLRVAPCPLSQALPWALLSCSFCSSRKGDVNSCSGIDPLRVRAPLRWLPLGRSTHC